MKWHGTISRDMNVMELGVKGSWVQIPPSRRCERFRRSEHLSIAQRIEDALGASD
jgi:hypothetical protein